MRAVPMDLLTCSAPAGRIEPAPLTSLLAASEGTEVWGAFWGEDDGYYLRRTARDGAERWFQVGEEPGAASAPRTSARATPPMGAPIAAGGATGRRVVFLFRAGARGGRVTSLAIRVGPSRRRR